MSGEARIVRVALVGNPNTGKTTLFNRLTGLRHKTSNFPGTTLEAREGRFEASAEAQKQTTVVEVIDLPGIYSLELEQLEAEVCRGVLAGRVAPKGQRVMEPDGVVVVMDATNLARNLPLAGEALRRRLPTVVALNMIDLAVKRGLRVDAERLSRALGCVVVTICARSGEGVAGLTSALVKEVGAGVVPTSTPPGDEGGLRAWADAAFASCVSLGGGPGGGGEEKHAAEERFTDRVDRVVTHPLLGMAVFAFVMAGLFAALFWVAQFPMGWIEGVFAVGTGWIKAALPEGLFRELLTDGVLAGVGATVVFLPQIVMLFFLIALLEDTGYLARAAFVMDRVLRPFGLPGHAFVPLLSSHACALPGIMATRSIPDPKERLATILVAPFMTCSARLPVYVLLTGLLFPHEPLKAGLAFVGCYLMGMIAGVVSALIARRTILRGQARAMALELPSYKRPSVKTAGISAVDRGLVFLKKAGTTIMAVSVLLWWLGAFPHAQPPGEAVQMRERAALVHASDAAHSATLAAQADALEARHAKRESFLGHLGRGAEPVLRPLGYDWQLSIGVLASFAARETFVGTMSIVITGSEAEEGLTEALGAAVRDDGRTPVFTPATCWSLLVFYVLAMQCLPTLVVSAKESGSVKWPLLQLGWMSMMAYVGAFIAFRMTGGTMAAATGGSGRAGIRLPVESWEFWLVSVLAVGALGYLLRNIVPVPWLSKRAKRKKQERRATLTIGGEQVERK